MQSSNERPVCHRSEDLVTYLYHEAGDADAMDFRNHMQQCDACRSEFAVFNQVHESIQAWRNEALGPAFVSATPAVDPAQLISRRKLSAWAAVREFFAVSPLWLRGATAFAGLLLCGLLVFAVSRFWERPVQVVSDSGERKFTQSDLDKAVADARRQAAIQQTVSPQKPQIVPLASPRSQLASSGSSSKPRVKALTRQEREQLASDLRLTSVSEEEETTLAFPGEEHPN